MFDNLDLLIILKQFHFIRPQWLLLLPIVAMIVWLQWKKDNSTKAFPNLPEHLETALVVNGSDWRANLPLKLLSVVLPLAIVICAGPTWQRQASPNDQAQSALLILLDSSNSMLNQDVAPNRLERSKQKIQDLLELRGSGSTGLIAYSGSAHLAMPLTDDPRVLVPYLTAISPDIMPAKGKHLGLTLPLIKAQFDGLNVPTSLLILSDTLPMNELEKVAHYFASTDHQLIILAMNADKTDRSLLDLAKKSDGNLYYFTTDNTDIASISRQIKLHAELNSESVLPWKDAGYLLLFPLTLLYLMWFRRGWLVQWCVLGLITTNILIVPTASAQQTRDENQVQTENTTQRNKTESNQQEISWLERSQQVFISLWITQDQLGQWYSSQGEPKLAAAHFVSPQHKAMAYFNAGEYEQAASIWVAYDDFESQFNLAMALVGQREYVAAKKLYQQLLERQPDNDDVAKNLKVVSDFIQFINDFSEGQSRSDEGQNEQSFSLPDDQPQTADGHEQNVMPDSKIELPISADEMLANPDITEQWLQRVEAGPEFFLKNKFSLQYRESKL
ncbi:VWA domain-containing protein [Vibrio tasmaniensis]|uniref:VWA domain-containing protein n=1 Tax=Vibrio tasmaniensis TaxID=212663 RepID=UPI0011185912|nr:VWA domain-containing protein [Vibrio tasmaniensis]